MPKLAPVSWQALVCVFEQDGFKQDRNKGSHIVLTKDGVLRPVIIPKYAEVGLDIITSNMRTAGMTRKRYFQLLNNC